MQVKKFEAKTMKEALELVKIHLGPEAIILSAKDSHKGFGLMGEKSVEVTAAVTEETLRKKKIAESKLREDLRARFQQIPASRQKEFINRVYSRKAEEARELATVGAAAQARDVSLTPELRAQLKGMRYIDISDDTAPAQRVSGRDRVRRAAARARMASADILQDNKRPASPPQAKAEVKSSEVAALESQVRELKQLIEQFQKVPQVPLSSHPGAEWGLMPEMAPAFHRMTGRGIQPSIVNSILKRAQTEMDPEAMKKPALVDAWVVRDLLHTMEASPNPLQGRYHVFIGSTGQGKTSTLVKFAAHLLLKERRTIAILSVDTIKVGAAEQLKTYAQILNVPFAVVRRPEEWRVAEEKLKNVQHILVDTPGFSLKTMEEADWLKRMLPSGELNRTLHYVQSALARDEESFDLASRYQMIGLHDVIFTRVDEAKTLGLLLNFQDRFHVPIHSLGFGTKIPEDFELATRERIVDLVLNLSRTNQREVHP